jgi:hypothetical protein
MTIQVWDVSSGTAYTRVAPSNTMLSNVSATDLGTQGGGVDQIPANTPSTWFIRITQDGGTTWTWVTLASLGLGIGATGAPVVTALDPSVSWTDPTLNTDGSPITPGELSGYLVGIRDVNAPGSTAGTYPKTSTVTGGSATSAPLSGLGFLAGMVRGGTYGIAAESEVGGAAVGAWSAEMVFIYNPPIPKPPVLVPMAPTSLVIT